MWFKHGDSSVFPSGTFPRVLNSKNRSVSSDISAEIRRMTAISILKNITTQRTVKFLCENQTPTDMFSNDLVPNYLISELTKPLKVRGHQRTGRGREGN